MCLFSNSTRSIYYRDICSNVKCPLENRHDFTPFRAIEFAQLLQGRELFISPSKFARHTNTKHSFVSMLLGRVCIAPSSAWYFLSFTYTCSISRVDFATTTAQCLPFLILLFIHCSYAKNTSVRNRLSWRPSMLEVWNKVIETLKDNSTNERFHHYLVNIAYTTIPFCHIQVRLTCNLSKVQFYALSHPSQPSLSLWCQRNDSSLGHTRIHVRVGEERSKEQR